MQRQTLEDKSPNAAVLPEWVREGAECWLLRTWEGGSPYVIQRTPEDQPHPVRARILEVFNVLGIATVRLGFPFHRLTVFRVTTDGRMVEVEAARGVPLTAGVTDSLVPPDSPDAADRSAMLDAALVKYTRENDLRWLGATVQTIAT
jgi:hypothetical protein